jgi:hypothetical protein
VRIAPELAAPMIMASNTGAALALICRPEFCPDPVFAAVVTDLAPPSGASRSDAATTFRPRPTAA